MKGWYGDKERHSLASRGIKTSIPKNNIQYKQQPRFQLIEELEYDLESVCANGMLSKAKKSYSKAKTSVKAKTSKVKTKYSETKDKYSKKKSEVKDKYSDMKADFTEKKTRAKSVGKKFTDLAITGGSEFINMLADMKDSTALLQLPPEEVKALPQKSINTLNAEVIKIDNDVKKIYTKIKERKKEIRGEEKENKDEFIEWYKVEKNAHRQVIDAIQGSGGDSKDVSFDLRDEKIRFKARVEQKKHLLNSYEDENDADIEYMRDLTSDLKRLKREIKSRVAKG